MSVALSSLETGRQFNSREEFEIECCQQLGDFWLRRCGWDSFRAYVMKHGGFSREAYDKLAADARLQAIPQVSKLIHAAMSSPGGRLPKRGLKRNKPIAHTPDGLSEELN
jgi:hypothetical protein